ncbi:NarK/NasA family nitrate transporter [Acidiphilium sp. PA]|uniref:nitrate/nitrite transporter n=1 Tax=Acidiphilium sp. PA TaxID=2871705 RepID=UPI002242EA16|nr:nitrate/nitrite transporter [Acidiphilium sp. PA]MCW8308431.1 NarK/NasA family nitrate transporter [Acidiphilium sp. PA]
MRVSPDKSFLKAGHLPSLLAAFLYFDMSFTIWVLLGPLAVQIGKLLHLDPAQKGLMIALPVLSGALLRIVAGFAVDQFGARATAIVAQIIVILGLGFAWWHGITSYHEVLALGLVLGIGGASFAIALPLASRWYPPEHQGTALGIAGAGNIGTVVTALAAPSLAIAIGIGGVFGIAAILMILTLIGFALLARNPPAYKFPQPFGRYFDVLKPADTWWFMGFYGVTFGGFVGLSAALTLYFHTVYGLTPVNAGFATAVCAFVGGSIRPFGGYLADRLGGVRVLSALYLLAAAALIVLSMGIGEFWPALAVFIVVMAAFGMGDGAVFQLIPARFGREIGTATGFVGMAGGVGGFYLASSLGVSKQLTGSYGAGFLIFAGLALLAFGGLSIVKRRWRADFTAAAIDGVPVRV